MKIPYFGHVVQSEFSCCQHNRCTQLWWGAQARRSQASISLAAVASTHLSFSCGSCKGFIASLCNVFLCVWGFADLLAKLIVWTFSWCGLLSSLLPALSSVGAGVLFCSLCSSFCYCDFKLSACKWLLYRPSVLFLLCGCFLVVCSLVSLSFSFLRTRQAYR